MAMNYEEEANKVFYMFYNELEHTFNTKYEKHATAICNKLAIQHVNTILDTIVRHNGALSDEHTKYSNIIKILLYRV